MQPNNKAIKGKLFNQYIYFFLFIYIINLLYNIYFHQLTHIFIYCFLIILTTGIFSLNVKLKNSKSIRFILLFIMSLIVFYFDSYYSADAMVYIAYISIIATFPLLFDIVFDYKYIIALFFIFFVEILINIYTNYTLFYNQKLLFSEIRIRRINEVLQLFLCIVINIYFIYQLKIKQLDKIHIIEQNFLEKLPTSEEIENLHQLVIDKDPLFMEKFKFTYPFFEQKLLQLSPNMIISELEVCAFIKLKLTTKEIAYYSNSSIRSIEGKKYRIRKKLSLGSDIDLAVFIYNI